MVRFGRGIALIRLKQEHKMWQQDHPIWFVARPIKKKTGKLNLMAWNCAISGKKNTPWEGRDFKLRMYFDNDYPSSPPKCVFKSRVHHPNVDKRGVVYMPMLDEDLQWRSKITIQEILMKIQELMTAPDIEYAYDSEATKVYKRSPLDYEKQVRHQA